MWEQECFLLQIDYYPSAILLHLFQFNISSPFTETVYLGILNPPSFSWLSVLFQ